MVASDTLLHIEASPRKERSHALKVARAFIEAHRRAHPATTVETLDLWHTELPPFDGATIAAKYAVMHGKDFSPEEAQAWGVVKDTFQRFASANKYLFSVPMWNFGIPYRLKHYIDVITQPGLAFRYSPEKGFEGLVPGKPALVIYASGGGYPTGTPSESFDLQKPYMRLWLKFIGFKDIREIVVDNTLGDPNAREQSEATALEKARSLAGAF